MVRRPRAPQSARTPARPRSAATPAPAPRGPRSAASSPARPERSPGSAGAARSPGSPAAPRPEPGRTLAPRSTTPTAPAPRAQDGGADTDREGGGRVVQAAERFGALVAGRPWRRRRRAILAGLGVLVVLAVAAVATLALAPPFQLQRIEVSGLGYVEEAAVLEAAQGHAGTSVLLLPTSSITTAVQDVPGVRSAQVQRSWPDGLSIEVTEATPVSLLTRPDGSPAVLDAAGQELPLAAGEGASLVPLEVAGDSADPEGAVTAMSEVLAGIPDPLRAALQSVSAGSDSDVTLEIALEDGQTKTVVWGDARDAELKAEVVQALLGQPGSVIDVSSPVAPVTR